MKINIVTIGAPQLAFAKKGFEEYIKRLSRFHKVHVQHLKDDDGATEKMLGLMRGVYAIALDEHGEQCTSAEFAKMLSDKALHGISEITFVIGGPNGHPQKILDAAQTVFALGKMTLPHDLAMLFTAEAIYRASTISAGHPYHRE